MTFPSMLADIFLVTLNERAIVRLFCRFLFGIHQCFAHTPSTAFRHLPPNSARIGNATEGALFHLRAAVHRRCQRRSKGLGINKTVEAT